MFKLTFLFLICSLVGYGQLTERESKVVEEVKNVCCYLTYTNNRDILKGNDYKEAHLYPTMLGTAIARAFQSIAYEVPEVAITLGLLNQSDLEKIVAGFFIAYPTSEGNSAEVTPFKAARSFAEINSNGRFESEDGTVYTDVEALSEYWVKRYTLEIKGDFSLYLTLKLVELETYGGIGISKEVQEYLNSDMHKLAIQKGIATIK